MLERAARNVVVLTILALPAQAWAQESGLATILLDVTTRQITLAKPAEGFSHEAHFQPGSQAYTIPTLFSSQLAAQLTTSPIASPSGGFTFSFDPGVGAFTRSSSSFGPNFAERALTNGKGKLTVGASFQYSNYTSYEGEDLGSGSVSYYLTHLPIGDFFFEGDLIQSSIKLDVSTATTTAFAAFGVTDRLDLGLVVPLVRVDLDATVESRVLRFATGAESKTHTFQNGTDHDDPISRSGSASGLGDMLVRAKYRFWSGAGGGIAVGADVRLPTGDEDNLLGAPGARTTFTGIFSSAHGRLSPHVNVAYTIGTDSDTVSYANPDEFSYRGGVEFALTPRVTLSGTMLGRSLQDIGRLERVQRTVTFRTENMVPGSMTIPDFDVHDSTLNVANLAIGAKANLTRTLLLTGSVLLPLTSGGVTAKVTPVIGIDYTF